MSSSIDQLHNKFSSVFIWWNDSACIWHIWADYKHNLQEDCRFTITSSDDYEPEHEIEPLELTAQRLIDNTEDYKRSPIPGSIIDSIVKRQIAQVESKSYD